jgi:uncharacterized membrane-anchored protein
MNMKLRLGCYLVMALAQVAVPATMIWGHERTLAAGSVYKFRTQPVDPYDAFRGRYVSLRIEESHAPLAQGLTVERGQKVYALIEVGADGFARLSGIRISPPVGVPYLTAHVYYVTGSVVQLRLPFDRYYMEESRAPAAERAYQEHSHAASRNTYITVRVLDGTSAVENLWIEGISVHDFVSAQ